MALTRRSIDRKATVLPYEETPLWRFLQESNFSGVEGLVRAGVADLGLRDPTFGWTPILFAANGGALSLVNLLAKGHAKLAQTCGEGNTALHLAARSGHLGVVEYLVGRNSDVNAQNKNGWNALFWAAINGHSDLTDTLISARVDVEATDCEGRTACMWAAKHGHVRIVDELIRCGVNFTVRDNAGLTAMDHAEEHLELRAQIVMAEELNRRILDAAQRNDAQAVQYAVRAGASLDPRDDHGWTPLMWAVLHDSHELARLLVQHGASPHLLGEEAELGERLAARHLAVSETLGKLFGANERLLVATKTGHWSAAGGELQLGAYANTRDTQGQTPLMCAARGNGPSDLLAALVQRGALVDLRDVHGWTATVYAVSAGGRENVSLLHHCGADFTLGTFKGESVLHHAHNGAVVQLLLAARASMEEVDPDSQTPLHVAAAAGNGSVTQTLLFYGANARAEDCDGRTPFFLAAAAGHEQVCAIMLGRTLEAPPEVLEPPELEPEPHDSDEECRDSGLQAPPSPAQDATPSAADAALSPAASRTPSRTPSKPGSTRAPSKPGSAMAPSKPGTPSVPEGTRAPSKPGSTRAPSKPGSARAPSKPGSARAPSKPPSAGPVLPITARDAMPPSPLGATLRSPSNQSSASGVRAASPPSALTPMLASPLAATSRFSARLGSTRLSVASVATASPLAAHNAALLSPSSATGRHSLLRGQLSAALGGTPTSTPAQRGSRRASGATGSAVEEGPAEDDAGDAGSPDDLLKLAAEMREEKLKCPERPPGNAVLGIGDSGGRTPLLVAARSSYPSLVALFLEHHANVDAPDNDGNTPLMEAAARGGREIVELLLAAKPRIDMRNDTGLSAADLAQDEPTRELLQKAAIQRKIPFARPAPAAPDEGPGPAIFRVRVEQLPTGLPEHYLVRELRALLRALGTGKPLAVEVLVDPITQRPKGFAHLDFSSADAASLAVSGGTGRELCGSLLRMVPDAPAAMVR